MKPEDREDMEQYVALARAEGRKSKRKYIEIDFFRQHWTSRSGVRKDIPLGVQGFMDFESGNYQPPNETSIDLPKRFRDFVMSLRPRELDSFWRLIFDDKEIAHWEKYELKKKFKEYMF